MVEPDSVVDGFRAKRLNTKTFESVKQFPDNFVPSSRPAWRETTPEGPARPLEDPLSGHIVGPLAGTMEAVAVALNREMASLAAFNHKINLENPASGLRLEAVAAPYQLIERSGRGAIVCSAHQPEMALESDG
jgi:hypothetical protein